MTHKFNPVPPSDRDSFRNGIGRRVPIVSIAVGSIASVRHVNDGQKQLESEWNIARRISGFCCLEDVKRILRREKEGVLEGLEGVRVPDVALNF